MRQHSRKPAAVVLTVAVGVSVAVSLASGRGTVAQVRPGTTPGNISATSSLEELELAVAATTADARTWFLYGERLWEAKRFAHAAQAYGKVLELEPYHRESRLRCASALALAGDENGFFNFMRELVFSDAKLAVDLFERRECRTYLAQPRFQSLHKEAISQATD